MPRSKVKLAPLCFVDARGGALAALAAGISRARGTAAIAATTSPAVAVPPEIGAVLAEIGAEAKEVVLASSLPPDGERIDLASWGLVLHEGEGDLERYALARIARDRIERRLALGAG
jgi:hypothetical protein